MELFDAYVAIYLAETRGEITREERGKRIIALRDTPAAAGLTFEQRDAIANKAVEHVMEITDEVYFSPSKGRWQ